MKHYIDALRSLSYKLKMMGIPISGPSYIYRDKISVVHNTFKPVSAQEEEQFSMLSCSS